jgi:hypothetical protein
MMKTLSIRNIDTAIQIVLGSVDSVNTIRAAHEISEAPGSPGSLSQSDSFSLY